MINGIDVIASERCGPTWRAAFTLATPDTRAITLDFDASLERVRVTGSPGAVPPLTRILIGNLELDASPPPHATDPEVFAPGYRFSRLSSAGSVTC